MSQYVDNLTANTEFIEHLTNVVIGKISTFELYADETSTILGEKSMVMIDSNIAKSILKTNELLNLFYNEMKNNLTDKTPITINKIQSSNNGERSFDVQVACIIIMNGIERLSCIYINLTQGRNNINKKEKKVNKIKKNMEQAISEIENIQSNMDDIIDGAEKLQIANVKVQNKLSEIQKAEERVELAKQEKIDNYWVRKLQIIFFN